MGCSLSKKRRRTDGNPRIFSVINLDDQGQERNPGKIEITETHLVLTQRGKDAIRWPLNSLRRYGYEEELFSFESGRKSPTGPGIYAFKCRRAEALFNLLQDCIQRAGQEDLRLPVSLGTDNASRPSSLVELALRDHHPVAVPLDLHLYVNGISLLTDADTLPTSHYNPAGLAHRSHEYINYNLNNGATDPQGIDLVVNGNGAAPASGEPLIQYAELLHSDSTNAHLVNNELDANESSQPVYINVAANEISAAAAVSLPATHKQNGKPPMLHRHVSNSDSRNYTNVSLGGGTGRTPGMSYPYAQLDLANSVDNVSGMIQPGLEGCGLPVQPGSPTTSSPESPSKLHTAERAYATIDFDRTKAMQDAKLTNNDDGTRKTRHNSNVDELYG